MNDEPEPFEPANLIEWAVCAGLALIVFAWLARFGVGVWEG